MSKMRRARDTIPCPPPDDAEQVSGKFPVVVFLRERTDEHVAPHYLQVIHHGCCRAFDGLVEKAIRNSVVLAPMFRRFPMA